VITGCHSSSSLSAISVGVVVGSNIPFVLYSELWHSLRLILEDAPFFSHSCKQFESGVNLGSVESKELEFTAEFVIAVLV